MEVSVVSLTTDAWAALQCLSVYLGFVWTVSSEPLSLLYGGAL